VSEQNNTPELELSELLKIRRDKLKELQDSGMNPFELVKYDVDNYTSNIKENFEEFEGKSVSVAGRLMSKRGMGKASFCDLQDKSGRIQTYVRKDVIGDDEYTLFKVINYLSVLPTSQNAKAKDKLRSILKNLKECINTFGLNQFYDI